MLKRPEEAAELNKVRTGRRKDLSSYRVDAAPRRQRCQDCSVSCALHVETISSIQVPEEPLSSTSCLSPIATFPLDVRQTPRILQDKCNSLGRETGSEELHPAIEKSRVFWPQSFRINFIGRSSC